MDLSSRISSIADDGAHELGRQARKAALRMLGTLSSKAFDAGQRATRRALQRAGSAGAEKLMERAQRLPIQQAIDVAVPLGIAWEQWMEFGYFPEGTHRVENVERDGDVLQGQLTGFTSRDWQADVIEERECESFAWRSTEGSDSAGLVTFHELGERLTRIELELDIHPVDLAEAAGLALRLADRRVHTELRRLKANAELLSPDVYDELLQSNGDSPEAGDG
jgi:uncharacterized membrane protein